MQNLYIVNQVTDLLNFFPYCNKKKSEIFVEQFSRTICSLYTFVVGEPKHLFLMSVTEWQIDSAII